jgi:hypothetical protein
MKERSLEGQNWNLESSRGTCGNIECVEGFSVKNRDIIRILVEHRGGNVK